MEEPNIIPYKITYLEEFTQLNIEYMTWISQQLLELYKLDIMPLFEPDITQWVKKRVGQYTNLKPPEGRLYLIKIGNEVVGMGAIHKLSKDVGEIKRMYNKPQYQGKGLGKLMFKKLMEDGEKFGCTSYKLDTPKWSHAAQHIYKSNGFTECETYPESEIPPIMQPHWMYMEKKE